MLVVPPSSKGVTINTTMRLDHELFSSPETRAVDLSGLKFFQFKTDLIAARALYHSHSIKKASNNESIRFK